MSEIQRFIQLGNLADIIMGQSPDSASCNTSNSGLPFLQGCAEFGRQSPLTNVYCFPPLRISKSDSVLISVRAPVGKMNWGDQIYCIGRGLAAIKAKPNLSDTRFLSYSIEQNVSFLHRRSQGSTFLAVSANDIKIFPIPAIPYEKQQKISSILSTIDRTITQTEALIEKYQQIKAGLMHDLFTRGIGADGQLRPTRERSPELYWESAIGWIPKEWDCVTLSQAADLIVGFAFKSDWFQDDGINLLRGENVGCGHPDWKDKRCLSYERATNYSEYLLHEGDVVIGMDRTFTKSGVKITILRSFDCPSLLVQRVGKFVATKCNNLYLRWLLLSSKYLRDLINQQKGMDIPHLSKSEILAPFIPLPPEYEQRKIAEKIEMCNSNIQKERENLEKLQKQKSGLMHDLLTGKVPVTIEEVT